MAISILDRVSRSDIVTDPYPHLVVADALPADTYARLAAEYPSFTTLAGAGPHPNNTLYLKSAWDIPFMPEITAAWRDFAAYHVSRDFYHKVMALFADHVRAAHPAFEGKLGRRLEDCSVGPRHPRKALDSEARAHDVKLDAQFGINSAVTETSSVRIAHVDSKFKLVAGLLYFRHPDDDSTGGELELYRYDPTGARFDARQDLIGNAFEIARTVPYRQNILVMWVNSPNALHGVSPRNPTSHPRRYINFLCETYVNPEGLFSLQKDVATAAS